jgi:hypothetical protein
MAGARGTMKATSPSLQHRRLVLQVTLNLVTTLLRSRKSDFNGSGQILAKDGVEMTANASAATKRAATYHDGKIQTGQSMTTGEITANGW